MKNRVNITTRWIFNIGMTSEIPRFETIRVPLYKYKLWIRWEGGGKKNFQTNLLPISISFNVSKRRHSPKELTIINPVLISSTTPCFNETPINDLLRIESARMPCNERLDERYIQSFHILTITLSIKFSYRYSLPPLKSFPRPYSIFLSLPPSLPLYSHEARGRTSQYVRTYTQPRVVVHELVPRAPDNIRPLNHRARGYGGCPI